MAHVAAFATKVEQHTTVEMSSHHGTCRQIKQTYKHNGASLECACIKTTRSRHSRLTKCKWCFACACAWCHVWVHGVWIAYKGWLVVVSAKLVIIPLSSTMIGMTCSSVCTECLCCLTLCPRQRLSYAPLCRASNSSFTFSSVPLPLSSWPVVV